MKLWTVAVYEGGLASGGPEEGGWWFWAGELVSRKHRRFTQWGAYRLSRRLRSRFPQGADRSSVIPRDDDYEVIVFEPGEAAERWYPSVRPHYE